jgi:hypothetical protein
MDDIQDLPEWSGYRLTMPIEHCSRPALHVLRPAPTPHTALKGPRLSSAVRYSHLQAYVELLVPEIHNVQRRFLLMHQERVVPLCQRTRYMLVKSRRRPVHVD